MRPVTLSQLACGLDAGFQGEDVEIMAVSTDTRTLQPGDLYVALQGERYDGHDYLQIARDKQAAAAMVSRRVPPLLPLLQVQDTRLGLGRLGAWWRSRSTARLVAITGSNGKTTVKEMIAAVLAVQGSVLATRGNLNNDIGLPLTLTRLRDQDFAVVEMGANHPGEIGYLSRIARPDLVVLNNAGRAHLAGFGSVAGVARAKAEIIDGLGPQGVCVLNADDAHAGLWRQRCAGRRVIGFGHHPEAEVRSSPETLSLHWSDAGLRSRFSVTSPVGEFALELRLPGRHNQMNALAATAACLALDVEMEAIQQGLAALPAVPGRLCLKPGIRGSRLIDDSYNANPDSVAAAIEVLSSAPGRHLLVLGDLGELGSRALVLHAQLGELAKRNQVRYLFSCGELSRAASKAFGEGGRHFSDRRSLLDALRGILAEEDTVLIKGSRAAAMDKVVAALTREDARC